MKNSNKVESAWYLYKSAVSPCDIAKQLQIHKATAYRWVKGFKHLGLERTLQKRSNCKARTQSRKINQIVKNRIYKIRREKHDCCGEKIQYYYKKEYEQTISITRGC